MFEHGILGAKKQSNFKELASLQEMTSLYSQTCKENEKLRNEIERLEKDLHSNKMTWVQSKLCTEQLIGQVKQAQTEMQTQYNKMKVQFQSRLEN